jgi:hypothetical protein
MSAGAIVGIVLILMLLVIGLGAAAYVDRRRGGEIEHDPQRLHQDPGDDDAESEMTREHWRGTLPH